MEIAAKRPSSPVSSVAVRAGLFVANDDFGVLDDGAGGIGDDAVDGATDDLGIGGDCRDDKGGKEQSRATDIGTHGSPKDVAARLRRQTAM